MVLIKNILKLISCMYICIAVIWIEAQFERSIFDPFIEQLVSYISNNMVANVDLQVVQHLYFIGLGQRLHIVPYQLISTILRLHDHGGQFTIPLHEIMLSPNVSLKTFMLFCSLQALLWHKSIYALMARHNSAETFCQI